jgi:hypothetical protein
VCHTLALLCLGGGAPLEVHLPLGLTTSHEMMIVLGALLFGASFQTTVLLVLSGV